MGWDFSVFSVDDLNEFSDSKLRVGSGKSFHAFTVEGRKYSE